MNTYKYVAAGFIGDAEKLFNDFAKCGDIDFTTFCNVWKKHKFSYIFMGRPNYKEMREFISEIYQLTLNYMRSSALSFQIAAIYLLYSLYRSQTVISPVKIRISVLQYNALQTVHAYAIKQKVRTLHYVIDYLKKNCLELVANCTLYGPCCFLYKENPTKTKADEFAVLSDLKQGMINFRDNNIISNLKKMRTDYVIQKNSVMFESMVVKNNDLEVIDEYIQTIEKLTDIIGKNRDCSNQAEKDNSSVTTEQSKVSVVEIDDIGYRRFKLKQAAFGIGCHDTDIQEEENNVTDELARISLIKRRNYNKRAPVRERRIGRPKKQVEKDISDENEDSDFEYSYQFQQKHVHKSKRGPIGRKKTSYLKSYEGPVFINANQKPINNYSSSEEVCCDDIVF